MVKIAPFRGVMYNPEEIRDHGALLTAPPYDVLNDQERAAYHARHSHNILHVDFGPVKADDPGPYTWHERSAEILKEWLAGDVLRKLEKPAIFQMETECRNPVTGQASTRQGFVCLLRLEEFSRHSQVRPHEKTFSGHKEERFDLMVHTKGNLSQVFGFFPDQDGLALSLMNQGKKNEPDFDFKDRQDLTHRLWVNDDDNLIRQFTSCLADQKVYIADGHHRYETALNYRRHLQAAGHDVGAADYIMVYLCPMSDPGLLILPTHRLLNELRVSNGQFWERLLPWFSVESWNGDDAAARESLTRAMGAAKKRGRNAIGLRLMDDDAYYLLTLKPKGRKSQALTSAPSSLASLDTFVLSNIIFQNVLKLTERDLDDHHLISYVSQFDQAISDVDDKKRKAAFLLNPTSVQEILDVSEAGEVMPRKSTFFYPKVTTGLVMNLF